MTTNFEDLECWQRCNELKLFVKENILRKLPASEKFQLYSQILRASRSTTANIAEGWGRNYYKENIKFLLNTRGSVAEILDHSLEARSWGYINEETLGEIRIKTTRCIQIINGYIRYLRKENEK
ncbi:four helix bundle protein [Salinimicrobium tongyeongense]|uniref:Four helix bundle protein n=1 Tax=Salinimicrobium tongyeongense TaxID=2809707 RepID=A0ABY6NST0_9FLAO|nr:four helix bundle protein [Salinimicrobium tongyeongense]UZH55543.1 four helix bundle protein [Salinimicrobium tongyeongense]